MAGRQPKEPGSHSDRRSDDRTEINGVRYSDDPRDFGWVRKNVPCQSACPAGTDIPAYIWAIMKDKHGLSYEINREANVLPGVLGRICSRPCEDQCRHGWPGNGDPVAICHLKRAAADLKDGGHRLNESLYAPSGKRVAIVGSGPAGIAAAHDLSLMGHDVTLFEREKEPGGMLNYGIPEFRLPRQILHEEIHNALRLGVDLKTGVSIGNGKGEIPLSELRADFDAVLLSTGCMAATELPLRKTPKAGRPEKITNVEYGFDFLVEMHRGVKKHVGERVAVVGAGFTALDCARVARRLGAQEVTIHLRTTEEYIPVSKDEILETKREGITIHGLRTPVALHAGQKGALRAVQFVQNRLGGWRENGRRKAIAIKASEFEIECDTLLIAIGQKTVHDYLDEKISLDRWDNATIDEIGMTSLEGVFGAGDYVEGAGTVIEAVGQGREVAMNIDTWLMGRERRKQAVRIEPVDEPLRERAFDFIERSHMPTENVEKRRSRLDCEVEIGFDGELAHQEAKRCYLCNLDYKIDIDNCIYCRACIEVAPKNCIKMVQGIDINEDGTYGALRETGEWDRVGAIWIDNNECIRCGACYQVCPTKCISISRNQIVMREI
ncbi:Glutamate synthase [NADPH] small chain [hydrothermal vent metagenome]|uniref:Glutamate synthase [NADPH] small chain n=1 Tax=hydrothermal vent metagenome TaxID=652676 RepID=A0A3B0TS80_9ZZZZ